MKLKIIILLGITAAYFIYCYVSANNLKNIASEFKAKYVLAYLPAKLASDISVNETVAWIIFFVLLFLEIIIVYIIIKRQGILQVE